MANSANTNIIDGLKEKAITISESGIVYKTSGSKLSSELRSMLENLGLNGLEDVYIHPIWNGKDSYTRIRDIEVSLVFEIGGPADSNSIKFSNNSNRPNNGNTLRCTDFMPNNSATRSRKFTYNDNFRKIINSISDSNDIYIAQPTMTGGGVARNIGAIVVNFYKLMAMALSIKSNSPYNFTILDAYPYADGDDFTIMIEKYIDTSGSNTKNRNIDMSSIFRRR